MGQTFRSGRFAMLALTSLVAWLPARAVLGDPALRWGAPYIDRCENARLLRSVQGGRQWSAGFSDHATLRITGLSTAAIHNTFLTVDWIGRGAQDVSYFLLSNPVPAGLVEPGSRGPSGPMPAAAGTRRRLGTPGSLGAITIASYLEGAGTHHDSWTTPMTSNPEQARQVLTNYIDLYLINRYRLLAKLYQTFAGRTAIPSREA
jgi:hypothetical protein